MAYLGKNLITSFHFSMLELRHKPSYIADDDSNIIFPIFGIAVMENKLPNGTKVFALRSVNMLRKYSSLLDVPMSFLLASVVYTASVKDWCILHKAMAAHYSQNVWFRKLYMLFSRYILINTYDQIKVGNQDRPASAANADQINFRRQTSVGKRKTN